MSKVVKSVGRSLTKIVKGTFNTFTKIVKGTFNAVKSFAKSKLGKVIIAAAAIYFGGAALTGALGSSGAAAAGGLSGLSGAAANVGAAWSSLGTAGSALAAGEFGTAGSALASGFSGGTAAGASALADAGMATSMGGAGMAPVETLGPTSLGTSPTALTGGAPVPLASSNAAFEAALKTSTSGGGSGLIGSMMSSPYAAPAAIMGGTQLIGGVMQGYGAQQQQKHQEQLDAAARQRYSTNIGTRLWG